MICLATTTTSTRAVTVRAVPLRLKAGARVDGYKTAFSKNKSKLSLSNVAAHGEAALMLPRPLRRELEQGGLFFFFSRYARIVLVEEGYRSHLSEMSTIIATSLPNENSL